MWVFWCSHHCHHCLAISPPCACVWLCECSGVPITAITAAHHESVIMRHHHHHCHHSCPSKICHHTTCHCHHRCRCFCHHLSSSVIAFTTVTSHPHRCIRARQLLHFPSILFWQCICMLINVLISCYFINRSINALSSLINAWTCPANTSIVNVLLRWTEEVGVWRVAL